ncbi:MAG: hypothetical protein HYY84_10940 [Deltaproteobacteria bacterium]|nr:hypothetical protein [Deltaproteobacteria bacterium]
MRRSHWILLVAAFSCGSNPTQSGDGIADASADGGADAGADAGAAVDAGACPGYYFDINEFFTDAYSYANTTKYFTIRFSKKPDFSTLVLTDPPGATTDTVRLNFVAAGADGGGALLPLRYALNVDAGQERTVDFYPSDAGATIAAGRYTVHIEGGNGNADGVNDTDTQTGVKSDAVCPPVLFYDRGGQGAIHPADEDTDYSFTCASDGGFSCVAG